MRSYLFFAVFVFFLLAKPCSGQPAQLSAMEIMREAMQTAVKQNKNVFIIFDASWCGWCRKMDTSINDQNCKDYFYANYVIRHIDVDESKDRKYLENPGGRELRTQYRGDDQGIPFWLIFDKDGKLVADSQMRPAGAGFDTKGENAGCPATEKEVNYFVEVLKKTSQMSDADEAAVRKRFRQNENN